MRTLYENAVLVVIVLTFPAMMIVSFIGFPGTSTNSCL